jgi:transposase
MDKRELKMYKLEEAVAALLAGTPIKQIARQQKISRNTVKKYRTHLEHILTERPEFAGDVTLIMAEFRVMRAKERYSENHGWLETNTEQIEQLASKCDNYVRLFEVLQEKGFQGSYSSLQRYISKNESVKGAPVFRIETKPGEIAQVDFGSIGKLYDEHSGMMVKAYVFVMVLGYSRDAYYEIVRSQDISTWCSCHVHAFEHFGGVPRIVIPDNLKSAIIKAAYMDPTANRSYADCAKHYGFQIDPCLPGTPQHKGKVESGVKYVKNNFIPLREFKNFQDANAQLQEWNEKIARTRIHGTTRRKPQELFALHEKEALGKLPAERFEISIWKTLKVYRDIHIQCDKAYYSVPHTLRGEYVEVRKTASQVAIFHQNELVALHMPVLPGKRRTNMDHYPPDSGRYMQWDTDYCLQKAQQIGPAAYTVVHTLLHEEAIRNLRSAQNIVRLKEKYGASRLERACSRAAAFGNYTYRAIKHILENGMDMQMGLFETSEKPLSDAYARPIHELLQ